MGDDYAAEKMERGFDEKNHDYPAENMHRSPRHAGDPDVGSMPPSAGPSASGEGDMDLGCMPITRLSLRAAEFALTLICFSVVAAAQGPSNGQALGSSPIAFLLSIAVLACVYSAITLVLLVLALMRPNWDLSYRLPRPLLFADFAFLLLMFASACSAASIVTTTCLRTDYYSPSAAMWNACSLLSAGTAMGFLASFTFMADFWLTLVPVFAEI